VTSKLLEFLWNYVLELLKYWKFHMEKRKSIARAGRPKGFWRARFLMGFRPTTLRPHARNDDHDDDDDDG